MTREEMVKSRVAALEDIGTVYLAPDIPPERRQWTVEGVQLPPEDVCAVLVNEAIGLQVIFSRKSLCTVTARKRTPSGDQVSETRRIYFCLPSDGCPEQDLHIMDDMVLPDRVADRLLRFFKGFLCDEPKPKP